MPFNTEELLAVSRRYWRADLEYESRGEISPELERLRALWREEAGKREQWLSLLNELRRDLPGFSIRDATSRLDSGFRCSAYPPRERRRSPLQWVVVGCMSIMVPAYTVYGVQYEYRGKEVFRQQLFFDRLLPVMRGPAATLARRIEAAFGVSALPHELGATPIPLIVQL